jgi:hypothetical protein
MRGEGAGQTPCRWPRLPPRDPRENRLQEVLQEAGQEPLGSDTHIAWLGSQNPRDPQIPAVLSLTQHYPCHVSSEFFRSLTGNSDARITHPSHYINTAETKYFRGYTL